MLQKTLPVRPQCSSSMLSRTAQLVPLIFWQETLSCLLTAGAVRGGVGESTDGAAWLHCSFGCVLPGHPRHSWAGVGSGSGGLGLGRKEAHGTAWPVPGKGLKVYLQNPIHLGSFSVSMTLPCSAFRSV